jgi:predicted permease
VSRFTLETVAFWSVLLVIPLAAGGIAYRLGRLWLAQLAGIALLVYSVALPFLIGHELASSDLPDERSAAGFMLVLIWIWLAAICIAATLGGIFGDDRAPTEDHRLRASHRPTP